MLNIMLNTMKTLFKILACFILSIFSDPVRTYNFFIPKPAQTRTTVQTLVDNKIRAQNKQGLMILKELLQKQTIDQCVKEYTSNTTTFKMGFFNLSTSEQAVINNWLVYAGYIPLPSGNIDLARLPDNALLFTDVLYSYIKTQEADDRKVWLARIEEFVKISLKQQQSCLHALFPEYILTDVEKIAEEIYHNKATNQACNSNIDLIIEALPIELKMHIKRALHCIRISKAINQGISYISSGLQAAINPIKNTIAKLELIPQGLKDLNRILSSRYEVQKLVRSFLGQPNQTSEH